MASALMGHNVDPTRALGGIAQSCWQCLRAHRGAAVAYAPLDHVSTLGHLRLGARRSGNLIIGLCARAARTSDGRSIIEWRKHVVRLKHEPGLLPLPAPPTCPRPTSARHRLLGRESIGSCRSHSTFGPGLKNVAATTTTRMTADHTASLEESNAARLPLGYRDSCSAYVPFFMFSCSH